MKAHKGYYSLIQYCPDRGRAEVANVGVLLFCPSLKFIDTKMSETSKRVKKIFGKDIIDSSWLKEITQSIVNRIHNDAKSFIQLDDLNKFISTRANEIIFTEPRTMRVEHPENDLNNLFMEYVDHELSQEKNNTPQTIKHLDNMFHKLLEERKTIKIGYKFDIPEYPYKFHADYAYNNGRTNLIQLLDFDSNPNTTFNKAKRLGADSILTNNHLSNTHSVVVASSRNSTKSKDLEYSLCKLLTVDFKAEFIQSNHVMEYVERVKKEAH